MIFVTVGNAHNPFVRLVAAADEAASRTEEAFVVQSGHTPFVALHARLIPFMAIDEYDRMVRSARLVVAHAGSGSIIAALQNGKPLILMPRRKAFGEHVNDHQLEIVGALKQEGRARVVETAHELQAALADPPPAAAIHANRPPLLQTLDRWLTSWASSHVETR